MSFHFTVERNNKWEILYSHPEGETFIVSCKTEKEARDIINCLNKENTDA